MIERWIDLWLEWLDQFRHLFVPEVARDACTFCHKPMRCTGSAGTPGFLHYECVGCKHSKTVKAHG
jgi:hypothetical protein